jgi:hypothetical protein
MTHHRLFPFALLVTLFPFVTAARGGGCGGGAAGSKTPAPDVAGDWDITYDDTLAVEVTIGGAVYTQELGAQGGSFTIDHEGQPFTFDLDCAKPEVVCPSEAWPATVSIEQRLARYPHQMFVTLPTQSCSGATRDPAPEECGAGTLNPECDPVCDGEVVTTSREVWGVIDEPGQSFDLLLGAGIATNGVNCVLLGVSVASADLVSEGASGTADWRSVQMQNGEVTTAYSGGCLWAGDPDMDAQLEALVIGASVKFTTGFAGARAAQ